ncbi:MAG: hypothetical protein JW884_10825 [Deltaproteobacteria bacterium]|nr:hypothetical protein [Deltaproteobacteria bacterium]
MSNIDLTQAEVEALLSMNKVKLNDDIHDYPDQGGSIRIPLISENRREEFMLDVSRGRIELSKGTLQNRTRQVVVLVRLDYGGSPHRNPDGAEMPCPHLHIYREGYGDKWAVPVPSDRFSHIGDDWETLHDFINFCNIVDIPNIRKGLFT